MPRVLEQEINDLHANVCAGLADPKRIMMLYELSEGPLNVSELARSIGLPQPLVSRHLKVLRERGMVSAERVGSAVKYQLGDPRLIEALDLLRAFLRDQLARNVRLMQQFS